MFRHGMDMPAYDRKYEKELISLKKCLSFIVLTLVLSLCFGLCTVTADADEAEGLDNDAVYDVGMSHLLLFLGRREDLRSRGR